MSSKYQEFLQSEWWQSFRKTVKRPPGCSGCYRKVALELHHLFYRDQWTDTKAKDCMWLCRDCHRLYHEIMGRRLTWETYHSRNRGFIRAFARKLIRTAAHRAGYSIRGNPGNRRGASGKMAWEILEVTHAQTA